MSDRFPTNEFQTYDAFRVQNEFQYMIPNVSQVAKDRIKQQLEDLGLELLDLNFDIVPYYVVTRYQAYPLDPIVANSYKHPMPRNRSDNWNEVRGIGSVHVRFPEKVEDGEPKTKKVKLG